MSKKREITYAAAIREAIDLCMEKDPRVFIIGEGVPDPKGIFGTTLKLSAKYPNRVMDMPVSENAVTGVCIGTAIRGLRPIMTHQRVDFSLLSLDQIINNAAKWHYMFGGKVSVPLVIRMLIGRGWGQGAQHSQSLQALFAHIPGLKVVMPTFPQDAKGMLIAAVFDGNPVIFIEHRWLHDVIGTVPEGFYKEDLSRAKIIKKGKDLTIVATSYMVIESLKAAEILTNEKISVEVMDVRSIKPIDERTIVASVGKTGRLIAADTGYETLGFASEVISIASQKAFNKLKRSPGKITLPNLPTPTGWKAAERYYPTYINIVKSVLEMLDISKKRTQNIIDRNKPDGKIRSDVPDMSFTGPF
jgi:pyruvate dehydrogenase E1 component beta subunit